MTRISAGILEVAAIHTDANMETSINMDPSSNGRSALSTGANGFESARSL